MPEFNKETLMNSLIKQLEDILNSVCSAEVILRRDSDFRKVMDIIKSRVDYALHSARQISELEKHGII